MRGGYIHYLSKNNAKDKKKHAIKNFKNTPELIQRFMCSWSFF